MSVWDIAEKTRPKDVWDEAEQQISDQKFNDVAIALAKDPNNNLTALDFADDKPFVSRATSLEDQDGILDAMLLSNHSGISLQQSLDFSKTAEGKDITKTLNDKSKADLTLMQDFVSSLKETPENLKIGSVGLLASVFENLKRRGMQLSVLPLIEPELAELFEPIEKPDLSRKALLFEDPVDRLFRPRFGPSPLAAMSRSILAAPGTIAKVIRSEQQERLGKQEFVDFSSHPFTKANRLVVQGGVPSIAAAIGSSVLTGNPLVGLAMLGELEGGAAFEEQLQSGATPLKASIIGDLSEAAEIAGESLVFPRFIKGLTKGIPLKQAVILVAENATQEGITGFTQRFLEVFGKETTNGKTVAEASSLAFEEGVKAIPENAFVGGATLGLIEGPVLTVQSIQGKRKTTKTDQARQMDIIDAIEKGPVIEEEFIEEVVEERVAKEPTEEKEITVPQKEDFVIEETEEGIEVKDQQGEVIEVVETQAQADKVVEEIIEKPFAMERVKGEGFVIKEVATGKEVEVITKRKPATQRLNELNQQAKAVQATKVVPKVVRIDKEGQVITTEKQALKKKLREQEKAAARGFKAGEKASREKAKASLEKLRARKKLSDENKKEAVALVKEFITDKEDLDIKTRLLQQIPNVDTTRQLELFEEKIKKGIEKAERRSLVGDLKKAVKRIKPKKLGTKISQQAKNILDQISLSTPTEETVSKKNELLNFANDVLAVVPEDSVAFVEASQLKSRIKEFKARTLKIQELDSSELEQILSALQGLEALDKQEKAIAEIERSKEIKKRKTKITTELKPKKVSDVKVVDWVKDFIVLKHGNLEGLSDNINGGRFGTFENWSKTKASLTQYVYDVLNKGTDAQAAQNKKSRNLTREIVAKYDIDPVSMHKDKKSFSLENGKGEAESFDLTANERLSIFMHSRNPHNLSVMLQNGFDRTRVTIKGPETTRIRGFTRDKLDQIIESLTPNERAFGKELGKRLMDGLNANAINETSNITEGRDIAIVENYWPAERNILRRLLGEKIKGVQGLIEGMGILKERIGSGNPLVLRGFFETVNRSNKNVAAYTGMAVPLREAKSVLTEDIQSDFINKGWETEFNRILEHVERIEDNSPQLDPLSSFTGKILGKFAKSRFSLNAKISPRQYISVLLNSAYIDNRHLTALRGNFNADILNEIADLSPQFGERLESMRFDKDIGDASIQDEFTEYFTGKSGIEAFMNAWSNGDLKSALLSAEKLGLAPMKLFDTIAIVDTYRMVKSEIALERPDLKIGSEAYQSLLKERFEWVTRHTQPMWHVKDRSLLGSERNPFIRSLVMFSSQRAQIVRMVANATVAYNNSNKTLADLQAFGKAGGAVLFNVALFTLYGYAWAIGVQKREKEAGSLIPEYFQNLVGNLFFTKAVTETMRNVQASREGRFSRVNLDTAATSLTRNAVGALLTYQKAAEHYMIRDQKEGRYQSGPNKGKEKWIIEIQVATDQLADVVSGVTGLPYVGPKDATSGLRAKKKKAKGIFD